MYPISTAMENKGYHVALPHSFERQLQLLCPGMQPKEAMQSLLDKYGSIRGIARATEVGASLITVQRWGKRLGVTPPPVTSVVKVVRAILLTDTMGEIRDRLKVVKEEEGSWRKVAARLRVTEAELRGYRKKIGLVEVSKWKERCEGTVGLFGNNQNKEIYDGW